MTPPSSSPFGLHRVIDPPGVLPQAAWQLDAAPSIVPDEVRIRVDRLNLDAASYRQIRETYAADPDKIRSAVLDIIATRGKMQNPVTGSGGMLTGTVEEVGPTSPLGLKPGQRIATLVSLTLTPLAITDGLSRWDAKFEQIPCEGHAILFARSIAAVLPDDLPVPLSLAVLDVCGAPALTSRVVKEGAVVVIIGAAGKSGSLSAAAARQAGAAKIIGVVPNEAEAELLRNPTTAQDGDAESAAGASKEQQSRSSRRPTHLPQPESPHLPQPESPHLPRPESPHLPRPESPLAEEIVIADARDPVGLARKVEQAGGPADVTVVCVDVPGCEGGAILSTKQGGTVIFFSMATSFSAAALGAEGLAADVTMLVGNGYVPGHADLALSLVRTTPGLRALFERRVLHEGGQP
jgi:L-erythro-3,5-diaminohexanoate dehydrogenase